MAAPGTKVTIALTLAAFFAITVFAVEAKGQQANPDISRNLADTLDHTVRPLADLLR